MIAGTIQKLAILTILSSLFGAKCYGDHDFQDDVSFGVTQFGGKIVGVEWVEPHVLIWIVGNPGLPTSPQWVVQTDSASELEARGIVLDSFEILSSVSIIGYPSKSKQSQRGRLIYGLYLVNNPEQKALLNEKLLHMLPVVEWPKLEVDP